MHAENSRLTIGAFVGVACFLLLAGCRNDSMGETTRTDLAPPAVVNEIASATPSASIALPVPAPTVAALASRKVPGKTLTDGSLIGEFTFQRDAGDEGLVWLDAVDYCNKSGLSLCTSTQWQVACDADPAVAAIETWTMTPERKEGFVIRGGTSAGCRDNRFSPGIQANPLRAAACCSPAVAAAGRNIAPAMLKAMTKNVLDFERLMNARRASALRDFFDDPVRIFLKERSRADAVGVFEHEFGKNPDFHITHEVCDFSADAADSTYTADCRKIVRQGGVIGHVLTRYVFVGGSGKLRSMTDPAVYRPFSAP